MSHGSTGSSESANGWPPAIGNYWLAPFPLPGLAIAPAYAADV